MRYTYELHDSIACVPARDWESLRLKNDLATDRRLIRVFEQALTGQCRCWTVIVRDEQDAVAASASLCLFSVDAIGTTGVLMQGFARLLRRIWPAAMRCRVLFCGLPVPCGKNHLRIREDADPRATMTALHDCLRDLGRRERATLFVFKEFDSHEAARIAPLDELGYRRGEVPSAYVLRRKFTSLEDFCRQLKSQYRAKIVHSMRKFDSACLSVEHIYGSKIAEHYTAEVHRLYEAMWRRAEYRLEKLPADFFREIARAFGDRASMTLIRENGNVIAFAFGLTEGETYYNLYGGVSESRNEALDLYFNLNYRELDRAMQRGASEIHLGQTSEEFKARLGAEPQPLFFYARARGRLVNLLLRATKSCVFPSVKIVPARGVFKRSEAVIALKPISRLEPAGARIAPARSAENTAGTGDT